jgi:hypothetical protein
MGNEEKEFDEEFDRAFTQIKELRQMIEALQADLAALEKRELLRVRGNQYCRVCLSPPSGSPEPPISELEQKYHDASHAAGSMANPNLGLPASEPTVNWNDVESLVNQKNEAADTTLRPPPPQTPPGPFCRYSTPRSAPSTPHSAACVRFSPTPDVIALTISLPADASAATPCSDTSPRNTAAAAPAAAVAPAYPSRTPRIS